MIFNQDNGHYYSIIEVQESGLNWFEARDAAAAKMNNGETRYLVSVTSLLEQNFLVNNFPEIDPNYVWLGAGDQAVEGDWNWITGEPWNYTDWETGEPNGDIDENCLDYGNDSIKWNDENCYREICFYIVEYSD